jgi:hypothetical protein
LLLSPSYFCFVVAQKATTVIASFFFWLQRRKQWS